MVNGTGDCIMVSRSLLQCIEAPPPPPSVVVLPAAVCMVVDAWGDVEHVDEEAVVAAVLLPLV